MPIAAVRYASPALIPADLPKYAALAYASGVPGDVALLSGGYYLPTETVPADQRRVGVVQYLPGSTIPADMRRIVLCRATSTAYLAAVLADSPTGYWRLGEASGTSAADASGNGNTGTYTGGVTLGQPGGLAAEPDGTSDKAALFDGTSGRVSLASLGLSANAPLSIEVWAKRSATGSRQFLFNTGTADLEFDATDHIKMNDTAIGTAVTGPVITDATYHHLVATWDGTNGRLYQDGVLVAGPTAMAQWNSTPGTGAIGARSNNSIWFSGTVDEVAVYPTALSAARVLAHFRAGIGR